MSTSNILSLLEKIPIWKKLISLPQKVEQLEQKLSEWVNKYIDAPPEPLINELL